MTAISLVPARLDITWYRGDTRPVTIALPVGFDATGIAWRAQYRDEADGSLVTEPTVAVDVDLDDGRTLLHVAPPLDTDGIGSGVWDLQAVTGSDVRTWLSGRWRVRQDVTT